MEPRRKLRVKSPPGAVPRVSQQCEAPREIPAEGPLAVQRRLCEAPRRTCAKGDSRGSSRPKPLLVQSAADRPREGAIKNEVFWGVAEHAGAFLFQDHQVFDADAAPAW